MALVRAVVLLGCTPRAALADPPLTSAIWVPRNDTNVMASVFASWDAEEYGKTFYPLPELSY